MKVALIYGYAEGPRIAQRFITELQQRGHVVVQPEDADIIIAHSGGSYMIPASQAKLIMCINVPYYDSRWSFVKKLTKRVAEEGMSISAMQKFAWNNWYVYSQPIRSYRMYKQVMHGVFDGTKDKKVILVRNDRDLFGDISQDRRVAKQYPWKTRGLSGTHDDLWVNPGQYITLMEENV